MKIAVFNSKPYDEKFLAAANQGHNHELHFFKPHLELKTAPLADGFDATCTFVNDTLSADVIDRLAQGGVKLLALRCAGFNNVDLETAEKNGLSVVRVPAYSPYAVAEHALALILGLNRKLYRAYNRVREGNFALQGLMGFDLHGKTIGVIGTGIIGRVFCSLVSGFGCRVIAYDPYPNEDLKKTGVEYVDLDTLFREADVMSIHCPLTEKTHHLIDDAAIQTMKKGTMIVNTSRGGIIDTQAAINGLKSGQIGALGIDVYEEEDELFFEDLSDRIIQDDVFTRLLTFPNVLITGHQAFFTREALQNIAETTINNITAFEKGETLDNQVKVAA